jgi:two-component system, NtrC family, response regulator AlgB
LSDGARAVLQTYDWPGNVRELHNAIERAVLLCSDDRIGIEHLPVRIAPANEPIAKIGDPVSLEKLEEMHIRRVLAGARSFEEAAEVLGMDSVTLWRRRKKYGI